MDENLKKIADYFGVEAQKEKLIEELAELIVAITRRDNENIVEEMTDVQIMIEQLVYLMGAKSQVEFWREQKIERTLKRIETQRKAINIRKEINIANEIKLNSIFLPKKK